MDEENKVESVSSEGQPEATENTLEEQPEATPEAIPELEKA